MTGGEAILKRRKVTTLYSLRLNLDLYSDRSINRVPVPHM